MSNNKKKIPIVFSSSNRYVPYLGVAIQSIAENANKDFLYEIWIFYQDISEYNIRKLSRFENENIKICFYQVNDTSGFFRRDEFFLPGSFVSKETYFRLFAADVLCEYERFIYLDSDLVVQSDLVGLYEADLNGHPLGAVWNFSDFGSMLHICENMKIPSERCVNCGVLLIDVGCYMEKRILTKCMELSKTYKKPQWADQELLNVAVWDQIELLDSRWNFQLHALLNEQAQKPDILTHTLMVAGNNPYIIHYSGDRKPWNNPGMKYAEYFWKYARHTEFYEEIILNESVNGNISSDIFEKYRFPFDLVRSRSRVVLYGMGHVGKIIYDQNKKTDYCEIVACVDKNHQSFNGRIKVRSPDVLKKNDYDYVVVCAEFSPMREEMVRELLQTGVEKEKIVSYNPLRK